MTKELAIAILSGDTLGTTEQTHEAVKMAIEAILEKFENRGCSGGGLMQKYIDAIETLKCVKINLDITDGENPSRTAAFDLAIYALKQLEKSRWIPVDERLPEEKPEQYLCTNGKYIWVSNWSEVMGTYCWTVKES